ncbi:hypothetical protein D9M69_169670 [compost metagenome]
METLKWFQRSVLHCFVVKRILTVVSVLWMQLNNGAGQMQTSNVSVKRKAFQYQC